MKRCCIGILAHVDAGKTTLSEALLYTAGVLRRLGRVDHRDAFLDSDAQERERGITIYAKQALFTLPELSVTLLDTPGHVDFSAEAERTLSVLDAAILVISGTDGVQQHTRTLWQLLRRHGVPVFLFINKMDLPGADRAALLDALQRELDAGCVDFSASDAVRDEAAALCSEEALDEFLASGTIPDGCLSAQIAARRVFPCYFGSALRLDGVSALADGLNRFIRPADAPAAFAARVFKITHDPQGARLTWMKITGGALRAKTPLTYEGGDGPLTEKADQLRLYSGTRFQPLDEAEAGSVVAVTGLSATCPGMALGAEAASAVPTLEPVLTYRLILPEDVDVHTALTRLRQLQEEDPLLHVTWEEAAQEIRVSLMGPIQQEVLRRQIADRFGWAVSFGEGSIVYKETIAAGVEGVGHFEPLRHYAEVHLLLEPLPRGSGLQFASVCPTDLLAANWQHLVMTHLREREHRGVLTGAPLTDVKITLLTGRAHVKHTDGGDFRQATYRAIRQGLMQAESILLEPLYAFRMELPCECVGHAITDIQTMGGTVNADGSDGTVSVLTGTAPVAGLRDYPASLTAYTRGRGRMSCTPAGYAPCRNQDAVVQSLGYEAERDLDNPADSVFCEHGSGVVVKWQDVPRCCHLPCLHDAAQDKPEPAEKPARPLPRSFEDDSELQAIFERTYGKVERPVFAPPPRPARPAADPAPREAEIRQGEEYLLVDGYNVIFANDALKALAAEDVSAARSALIDLLADYRGFHKCVVIVVFDAYKVKGNPGSVEQKSGVFVVYTKEAETADAYIERATYELRRERRVRVATSDNLEQIIILGHGALRISARTFWAEVAEMQTHLSEWIARYNLRGGAQRTIRSIATVTEQKKAEN